MLILKTLFWTLAFIVVYTYLGYGLVLYLLVRIRRIFRRNKITTVASNYQPDVTLFISAYNEKDYVHSKMNNSLQLNYPKEKLKDKL